jgi:hypothetical protein
MITICFFCHSNESGHLWDNGIGSCLFEATTFRRMTPDEYREYCMGTWREGYLRDASKAERFADMKTLIGTSLYDR